MSTGSDNASKPLRNVDTKSLFITLLGKLLIVPAEAHYNDVMSFRWRLLTCLPAGLRMDHRIGGITERPCCRRLCGYGKTSHSFRSRSRKKKEDAE